MQLTFTVRTERAAVIAKTAGSSISSRIVKRNRTWMRCYAHALQSCMNSALKRCTYGTFLIQREEYYENIKRIVENLSALGGMSTSQIITILFKM